MQHQSLRKLSPRSEEAVTRIRMPLTVRSTCILVCMMTAGILAGCADQDTYDNARVIDDSQQSSLGNPQRPEPIIAPPPLNPQGAQEFSAPRYQWNGNPKAVTEGASAGQPAKRPVLKPQPPSASVGSVGSPEDARAIEVQPGDTLHGIATRYGVTVASLSQANRLSGAPLQPGQRLVLPSAAR